jgi:hypothetical protein
MGLKSLLYMTEILRDAFKKLRRRSARASEYRILANLN